MAFLNQAQRLVNSLLKFTGVRIVPNSNPWLQLQDFPPVSTLIDVGVCGGTPDVYGHFPNADLILIDPLPDSEELFAKSVEGRNWKFFNFALGAASGSVTLHREIGKEAKSSLLERSELTKVDGRHSEHEVSQVTLDSLTQDMDLEKPVGLKIDTEGYELEVLKGATATLAHCAFVIVECSIRPRFESSYSAEELIGFLADQGFSLDYVLSNDSNRKGQIVFIDLGFIKKPN